MPFILHWTRVFARELPEEVALAGPDLGGALNTAKDLFETNLLFTAPYDDPQAFQRFLSLAAEVQASCYREVFDNGESAGQILQGFEEAVAALTPEVVAIPVVWLNQSWSDRDIRDLYEELRRVAERAAGQMSWVGGQQA
jgi:uroporphyrinogen-III decarboxylase